MEMNHQFPLFQSQTVVLFIELDVYQRQYNIIKPLNILNYQFIILNFRNSLIQLISEILKY